MKDREDYLDEIKKFYDWLMGENAPFNDNFKSPKLSGIMAFRIIYYLQEELHLIDNFIERCCSCNRLYDSQSEGSVEPFHCDFCRKDYY